jgi:hypothetical protein
MNKKITFLVLILLQTSFFACAGPSIFQPIPLNATPPVLAQPIFLAIDEGAARGYLINSNNSVDWANASLMVLDLTNPTAPTVIQAVALNDFSGHALLDSTNKTLYVTNRLSENVGDAVDQIFQVNIDESSPSFLSMTQFNAEANPFGITSDGTNLYVASTSFVDRFVIGNLANAPRFLLASRPPPAPFPTPSIPPNVPSRRRASSSSSPIAAT